MHRCSPLPLGVIAAVAAVAAVLGCTVDEAAVPVSVADGGGVGVDAPVCPSATEIRSAAGAACLCDDQCAGGACILGTCCEGEVCRKRPAGATCSTREMCASGFCADGVCCDVACDGGCLACNLAGKIGTCSVVPEEAADPHGRCRREPPESCGQTGQCNGQGGCARYAAGSVCRPGGCSDGHTLTTGASCDGQGQCQPGVTIDCAPWTCGDSSCRISCSDDSQCVAPARCRDGSCGRLALSSRCGRNDDCLSQNCADGVCCDSACGDRCAYCAFPGNLGHCVSVGAGAADPRAAGGSKDPERVCLDQGESSCGTNGHCDGSRGCQRYPEGTVCRPAGCDPATGTSTATGVCHQGSCAVPTAQSCAPFRGCQGGRCATFCAHDAECVAGTLCQGGSCGKPAAGTACAAGAECATGICAQGRCCMTACDGVCRSCALDGSAGVCTPVPAGGADPAGRCPDDPCSNGCDGAGACRREPAGATCRPASCNADGGLVTYGCTGDGACQPRTTPCGPGSACNAATGACEAVGRGPGQSCGGSNGPCQSGLGCVGGLCCAATSCSGPCLTGACKGDGSGCQPRARGTDCGTACNSASELATRTCNDAGACTTSTTTCPTRQTCTMGRCQPSGGCGPQCDNECTIVNVLGVCIPSPDGTPCHGRSGMTCQKCVCNK